MCSRSVPSTPQRYQEPRIGLDHCGVKLRNTGEEVRRKLREEFTLPLLIRASGTPAFVRLVDSGSGSVSDCCSYLLITDSKVIVRNGNGSPISARSKIAQMAHEIIAGKELPTCATRVQIADDDRKVEGQFWQILRGNEEMGKENMDTGQIGDGEENFGEDVVFEMGQDGTVGVLVRGQRPECNMLEPAKVLIFYFVSEIYVWSGSEANRTLVGPAVRFARSLKEQPISDQAKRIICCPSNSAPEWTLLRRLPEGIVDTLFKHKFEKWREPGKKPKRTHQFPVQRPMSVPCQHHPSTKVLHQSQRSDEHSLVREMALKMSSEHAKSSELVLEETVLRPEDGNVFTEGLNIYEVRGDSLGEPDQHRPELRAAEFDAHKCYVIGWEYRVERTGIRKLDGSMAEQRECGRRRRCYFYWLGSRTTVGEQSRCALALRDWDTERREQIRVEAGTEPPMMLHILGGMVATGTGSGVFAVIGSSGQQCVAQELRPPVQFRSQGAYLCLSRNDRIDCLRGQDCPEPLAQSALQMAQKLAKSRGLEGPREVKNLGANVLRPVGWSRAPRLFRFHDNEVWELASLHANANFTFQQKDLSDCMFVDQGSHLWIWSADQLIPSLALKIAFRHWYGEEYSPGKPVSDESTATVIYAGAEPDKFRALFAEWEASEGSEQAQHSPAGPQSLYAVIAERLKLRTVDELRRRELPPGADTKHLEDYLSEQDFERVFRMSRKQFGELPRWRQLNMKKGADLF